MYSIARHSPVVRYSFPHVFGPPSFLVFLATLRQWIGRARIVLLLLGLGTISTTLQTNVSTINRLGIVLSINASIKPKNKTKILFSLVKLFFSTGVLFFNLCFTLKSCFRCFDALHARVASESLEQALPLSGWKLWLVWSYVLCFGKFLCKKLLRISSVSALIRYL